MEALHYAVLLTSYGVLRMGLVEAWGYLVGVGAYLALLRPLVYGGTTWVMAWLLGKRLDAKTAVLAAAEASPALALALLTATPFRPETSLNNYMAVVIVVSHAVYAAATAWRLAARTGARGMEAARIALSAGLALLVYLATPLAATSPTLNVYATICAHSGPPVCSATAG